MALIVDTRVVVVIGGITGVYVIYTVVTVFMVVLVFRVSRLGVWISDFGCGDRVRDIVCVDRILDIVCVNRVRSGVLRFRSNIITFVKIGYGVPPLGV